MMQELNLILQNKKTNVNVNKTNLYNVKTNVNDVQRIATRLADKLDDHKSFNFYCKVAWNLSEYKIWANMEQALNGKKPSAYFTWLCKKDMAV